MYKILKLIALILGVVAAGLWIALVSSEQSQSGSMEFMFYLSYILLAWSVVASVFSSFKNILSSPKALKKTAVFVIAFAVVFVVSYALAEGENTTEKMVSTGLYSFYALSVVATGLLVVSGVKGVLTK